MNKIFIIIFLVVPIGLSAQTYYNLTDKVIPYRKGNLWGYADRKSKEILVKPIYDSVNHDFLKKLRWIPKVSKNGKWGLFAYNADKKNYELVVPIEYDSITNLGFVNKNTALWKNGSFRFLNNKFKNAFDKKDYFIDYFIEEKYDFTVILKRQNKNDVWYRQIVGGRPKAIVLDSIFEINKIVNEKQYFNLKKETSALFYKIINQKKEIIKSEKDNNVTYVTTEQPEHPKMYPLLFTNPNSHQQYVFYEYGYGKNKLERFIKVPTTEILEIEDKVVHRISSKKNQKLSTNTKFSIDSTNDSKKFKTKKKNKYILTGKYYSEIRLIQSSKAKKFGIAKKDEAFLPDNVLVEPIYKNVLLYKLSKYRETFFLVLEKSNGKKSIFYLNKIQDFEFEELQVFQSELRYSNNGLKGVAFRNRELTFLPPKFSEIPEPIYKYGSTDFLKVFIPNNVYYYLSTDGLEFYEK
jgi:hypothetical protein